MPTILESRCFGSLSVAEEEIFRFPDGLPGFEELHEFLVLSPPELAPVQFLLSVQEPDVTFPILRVSCLCDYAPKIEAVELEALGATDPSAVVVYAILTFHHEREEATANLRAPVLINPTVRLGKQVILSDSTHPLRHPLPSG
jgi:flagellar assembly factor FliW